MSDDQVDNHCQKNNLSLYKYPSQFISISKEFKFPYFKKIHEINIPSTGGTFFVILKAARRLRLPFRALLYTCPPRAALPRPKSHQRSLARRRAPPVLVGALARRVALSDLA